MTDSPFPLPHEIGRALNSLRERIRRYVLVEGISAVVALLCGLFWITLSLDVVHFHFSRLELPIWFRTACLLVAVGLLLSATIVWLLARVLRSFRSRALALVLERRFPQLGDRLITAVELADRPTPGRTDLGGAMLQRTIADAAQRARDLDLEAVFDRRPMFRWLIGGLVLLASVVGFGAVRVDAMERWFNAFVLLHEDYWEPYRKSAMTVRVLVQPGDRLKEFAADGTYRHPRGADLTLVADVPEGRALPDSVSLTYRVLDGGGMRGTVGMSQSADRRFRHTLGRVIAAHQLWVSGGDFINRAPYRVVIVDPPLIDAIVLRCDYPDYTGLDALSDRDLAVQGAQVSLPVETAFELRASANKPLVGVQIRCAHFDLEFNSPLHPEPGAATLAVHPQPPATSPDPPAPPRLLTLPPEVAGRWFSADGRTFRIPMVLATRARDDYAGLTADFAVLPVPADVQLQIFLEDTDDVSSVNPVLLTLNGVRDNEPVVETRRSGVGSSVTRMAEIPIVGRIRDDYGVTAARFGYRLEDEADFQYRDLAAGPQGQKEFVLGDGQPGRAERFKLLPLELQVDQQLTLTVFAEDGDNLNGPHVSHGEAFTFTIVTPDELLAQLYDKELNLRLRFEQIRREVQQVRDDLALHLDQHGERVRLATASPDGAQRAARQEEVRRIGLAIAASAERALHAVRKTHTESRSVEVGFADIREEMVNNRVDTSVRLQRIDAGILQPLHAINETHYPEVDRQIGLFRLANENNADPTSAINGSLVAVDALLQRMDLVLAQMTEREGFNEMVKMIQGIIDRTRKLKEDTQSEQERRLFDLIK